MCFTLCSDHAAEPQLVPRGIKKHQADPREPPRGPSRPQQAHGGSTKVLKQNLQLAVRNCDGTKLQCSEGKVKVLRLHGAPLQRQAHFERMNWRGAIGRPWASFLRQLCGETLILKRGARNTTAAPPRHQPSTGTPRGSRTARRRGRGEGVYINKRVG
jgi:hypothetical protein